MDFVSLAIIFFMGLALVVILMMPLIMNIPIYKFMLAKMRKSMLVLMLNPSKRLEIKEAEPKSSIIVTKKGNFHFLNTPDAVYSMFGIPTAVAYFKYGAIIPMQNIVHATEMRELGFKNIGEVENALKQLHLILDGDKEHDGMRDARAGYAKTVNGLESELNTFLFNIEEDMFKKAIESKHFPRDLQTQFKNAGHKLDTKKPEIVQVDDNTWQLKSNPESFIISKEVTPVEGEENATNIEISVYRNLPGKDAKQEEYKKAKTELAGLDEQIEKAQTQLNTLESTQIEESGIIRIQDIFNFLNKNLSTDVLFSIIERNVAEELRGMRDHFGKFQEMLPTILFMTFFFVIIYLVLSAGGGGGGIGGIGESISNVIPNIGAP